ncbi:hypothetical protein PGTUg99_030781 [Puccinia graminis f. sp. tritici]|uniref:Uncharacterized protein n=1 Tax=Puccinia graminis f. sp. tritici TaxID=56615 RepID=A0A5B0RMT9_PUCGR|nr:hypothetical protein PGTUg99_030781 [Puccinia graminis f. sp. tritici]
MQSAFRKLITAVPEDLSKLHNLGAVHTQNWIKNITRHYHKTLPPVPFQTPAQNSTKRTRSSDHTNTPTPSKPPKRIWTSEEHPPIQNQGQAMQLQSDQQPQSDTEPKQKTRSRKQDPYKSAKPGRSTSCPNTSSVSGFGFLKARILAPKHFQNDFKMGLQL